MAVEKRIGYQILPPTVYIQLPLLKSSVALATTTFLAIPVVVYGVYLNALTSKFTFDHEPTPEICPASSALCIIPGLPCADKALLLSSHNGAVTVLLLFLDAATRNALSWSSSAPFTDALQLLEAFSRLGEILGCIQ